MAQGQTRPMGMVAVAVNVVGPANRNGWPQAGQSKPGCRVATMVQPAWASTRRLRSVAARMRCRAGTVVMHPSNPPSGSTRSGSSIKRGGVRPHAANGHGRSGRQRSGPRFSSPFLFFKKKREKKGGGCHVAVPGFGNDGTS